MSKAKDSFQLADVFAKFFLFHREAAEAREVGRKPVPRNSLESEEYVKDIVGLLNAKDFRDRINGIKQLLSDAENNQDFVVVNIVKVSVWQLLNGKAFKIPSQNFLLKIMISSFAKNIWWTGKYWGMGQVCFKRREVSCKGSKGNKREEG